MIKSALRGIKDHLFRTILLGLAVVAGVSFVAASFVFTDTISAAFNEAFSSSTQGTDINITAPLPENSFTFQLPRVDGTVADGLENRDGVLEVYRSAFTSATIVVSDQVVPVTGPPQFVVTWSSEILGFDVVQGRAPENANEVMVDEGFFMRELVNTGTEDAPTFRAFELGDTIEVAGGGPTSEYQIVGVAAFGGGAIGPTWMFMEFNQAGTVIGNDGQYDTIDLAIDSTLDVEAFAEELQAELGDDVVVRTAQAAAEAQAAELQEALGFITQFLLIFAGISVGVGVFVVYNAFRTVIGQRSKELALFRLLGSTRGQVVRSVLVEAAFVGAIASVVGVGGGIVLAFLLESALELTGSNLPDGPLQVLPRTVITAVAVGIITTLVSALIPAWRASRIAPIQALGEVEKPPRGFGKRQIASLVLFAAGIALSIGAVLQNWSGPVLTIGLVAFVIGTYLLGAIVAQPVINLFSRPIQGGITGNLARQNAQRSPRRTAATAGALMIGVGLVTAVSILTVSIQETARAAIEDAASFDLLIQQEGFNALAGISEDIAPIVETVDGVSQVSAIRGGPAQVADETTFVAGVDPADFPDFINFEDVDGDFAALVGDAVAIQKSTAEAAGIALGSTVDIDFGTGARTFTAVALWDLEGDTDDDTSYYINRDTYKELVPAANDIQVSVKIDDGADLGTVKASVEAALEAYPTAAVSTIADLLVQIEQQLNGILALIFGLLAMSVAIALLGVLLTLLLSVFERTREIGLLRAVGMVQGQIKSMVRWESIIVAIFGAILGVGVGLFLGWVVGRLIFDEGAIYTIPWLYIAAGFVAAAFAGLLAAWWPARWASKLNILEAIAYE